MSVEKLIGSWELKVRLVAEVMARFGNAQTKQEIHLL